MDFADIKRTLEDADKDTISKICAQIIELDYKALNELAQHFDELRLMVAKLPIEKPYGQDYRYNAHLAMNLLANIANNRCKCLSYNAGNRFNPETAQASGLVTILEDKLDKANYTHWYKYQCVKCNRVKSVTIHYGSHVPSYTY
ncbi:hypothetical protein C1E24_15755 [Pseudoalteromonas phenolica]|uniref:Uncharacterized protein n=1 Tax=Pseudoalteromonas phenolica TaxID=161398 RepID=A0A5R9Q021_9GAMM|nr:hypothetical protein [Pseudoalteromonas phenolica]TLX45972.1 hypothetical protein C1E24_15755 [Pseudoalteromonas phenolica]